MGDGDCLGQILGVADLHAAGGKPRAGPDRRLDFGGGDPSQNQQFYLLHHHWCQGFKGDFFIVAPGQDDHLLVKGVEAGDGSGGAGGDGIVVPFHPAELPDKLNAVLYPAEGAGHLADHFRGDLPPHGADGRQIVFHVVQAGDADPPHGQNGDFLPPVYHGEGAVLPQKGSLFRLFAPGEEEGLTPRQLPEGGGDLIV